MVTLQNAQTASHLLRVPVQQCDHRLLLGYVESAGRRKVSIRELYNINES